MKNYLTLRNIVISPFVLFVTLPIMLILVLMVRCGTFADWIYDEISWKMPYFKKRGNKA